jgi:hypothetical protein
MYIPLTFQHPNNGKGKGKGKIKQAYNMPEQALRVPGV